MMNLFLRRRWRSPRIGLGILGCLSGTLLVLTPAPTLGQQPSTKGHPSGARARDTATPSAAAPAPTEAAAPAAPAPDAAKVLAADPIQTRRVEPNEIFKDPHAEQALEIGKFPEERGIPVTRDEILKVKEDAGNINSTPDRALIERYVQSLAAQLTVHRNIQALMEPPVGKKSDAGDPQAIQNATTNLLEPLFMARSAKNQSFLAIYQRALLRRLEPLLKNHLIARVQAMIVLGESGIPDALRLYENQIRDRRQTLWVKLWALEGITNIKLNGGRLLVDAESGAAKTIADFLENNDDLPWPVKLRALEALGALRQAFLPTQPTRAHMAQTAMLFLADPNARFEVRAEAARTLGLMQITGAVPKYNFALIAHTAGQVAADLGAAIDSTFSVKPVEKEKTAKSSASRRAIGADFVGRADLPTKARYLTALLIGPVCEAFNGVPTAGQSGLLHAFAHPSAAYVQKVFDHITPVAQTAVQLLGAPTKEIPALKKGLETQVAVLRDFLAKNPPPDRHLVQGGKEFGSWAKIGK